MQILSSTTFRPPWPDEKARLQHFLPAAFLWNTTPFARVAVRGRVERFVGAATLTLRPFEQAHVGLLSLRVDPADAEQGIEAGLIDPLLAIAWEQSCTRVYVGSTFEADSPQARGLSEMGLVVDAVHEVYDLEAAKLFERLDRIYQRLLRSGIIPPDAAVITLHPRVIAEARLFLRANLPENASALALESAGYRPENSLALLLGGEVKGVILARRHGKITMVGLRAIAEELRGGIPWANLLLLYESLRSGIRTGLEKSRFELSPELHQDTQLFARATGAELVGKRVLFRKDNPAIFVDEGGGMPLASAPTI